MKITKILVALSFLFAVASANAGTMTVTGGMQATYSSDSGNTTGNPLGMDTELTFTGSTELDNGMTVTVMQDYAADANAGFGNSQIAFGNVLGLATIYVGSDSDPVDAIDDITPSAFEEANGARSGSHTDIGTLAGELGIGLKVSLPILGDVNAKYYPKTDTTKNGDKANSNDASATVGSGSAITIKTPFAGLPVVGSTLDGLVLTTGYTEEENSTVVNTDEVVELTAALNYAYGPLSLGYQKKYGNAGTTVATTDPVWVKADVYGIAYAINDSLSISYNKYESYRHNSAATGLATATSSAVSGGDKAIQDTTAINIGYTVGGMTFGFQDAQTDNAGYILNNKDDTRTFSVVVAF